MFSRSLLTLARPYAQAVFDFACEHEALEKWQLMLICIKNIMKHPIVIKFTSLTNCIGHIELSKIIIIIGEDQFDHLCRNFIRLLSEYKRLHLISIILDEFLALQKRKKMVTKMEIVTPIVLNNNEVLKIVSVIKKQLQHDVDVICTLDPSIIGGIVLRINNFVIDGSIRKRIEHLRHILVT